MCALPKLCYRDKFLAIKMMYEYNFILKDYSKILKISITGKEVIQLQSEPIKMAILMITSFVNTLLSVHKMKMCSLPVNLHILMFFSVLSLCFFYFSASVEYSYLLISKWQQLVINKRSKKVFGKHYLFW
jgi:hypothetical protein